MIGKIFLASPEHISLFILWLLPWEEWSKVAYINFDYHYGIKRIEVLCKIYGFVLPGMQSLAFLSNANSKLHNWLKDLRKIHFGISKANRDSDVTWQTWVPDKKRLSLFFFYVSSFTFFHLTFWQDFIFLRKIENMEEDHSSGFYIFYVQKKYRSRLSTQRSTDRPCTTNQQQDWCFRLKKVTVFSWHTWTFINRIRLFEFVHLSIVDLKMTVQFIGISLN